MILVFKNKSVFNFIVSIMLSIFDCKILITNPSESFFFKHLKKLGFKLSFRQILYLDMSEHYIENIGDIDGDFEKISNKCVKIFCQNINHINYLNSFFPNIKNLQRKLKLFIYHYFDKLFLEEILLIRWLRSSPHRDKIIINLQTLTPGAKKIWCDSELRVIFLFNYFFFFIGHFINLLFLINKYFFKFFLSLLNIKKQKIEIDNDFQEKKHIYENDVLFFPHNSVVQFGHPPKVYFYSKKKESPFFPSKIVHLEYDFRTDIEFEKKKIKDYFNIENVCYIKFKNSYVPLLESFKFFIAIFKFIYELRFKNLKNNILYYYIIYRAFLSFYRCRHSLEPYKKAKIALVGYEMLFPKSLALALESLNIKTIASSERFVAPFYNDQSFMLDTLFSISEHSSKIIKTSDRFVINTILPVGQARTDNFFDKSFSKRKYKKNVVILDYHIQKDSIGEKFKPITNWKNDVNFRKEILSLAEYHKDINFIFRGKNVNWYNNDAHSYIKLRCDRLPNVKVDTDYSIDHWRSYNLCSSADLIIARPTSLAEECVSMGLNVIVCDYGINYTTHVSKFLPYLLRDYYCNSFTQLKMMFQFWKKNNYLLTREKKNKIKNEIFSNLTDGKVQYRIQKYLNEIYRLS